MPGRASRTRMGQGNDQTHARGGRAISPILNLGVPFYGLVLAISRYNT